MTETIVTTGMCRCCASEGLFKDVNTTYRWMGAEEIYAEMLNFCFGINLATAEDQNNGGICEVCITQLRNAANFKKQVLHTEEQFKRIHNQSTFNSEIVKVEMALDEGANIENHLVEDFQTESEFVVPIKEEIPEPPPKKKVAKASTSKVKKSRSDSSETSMKRTARTTKSETKSDKNVTDEKQDSDVSEEKSKVKRGQELSKHRKNMREILLNSNATPIRCHGGKGYACSFCDDQFPDPADLKKHTTSTHHSNVIKFMKGKDLYRFHVKLDITDLRCRICDCTIPTLEQLIDHLRNAHKRTIYMDIKNQILPFKFESESLRCFMCLNKFNKFKTLQEHMNIHYRNYICEVCDAGFVNRGIMIQHSESHKYGTFTCDHCPKVFNTLRKKKSHEKCIHTHSNMLNKCSYCSEKFKDYRKKEIHMTEVHGLPTQSLKCEACEKTFVGQKHLNVHIKRVHLLERRHKCSECEMRFFSVSEMKIHMLKHTGERDFKCSVCGKCYGRRRTLQEHMRIHANDRRFKCELCGQAFVQKLTLRLHMRGKHH